MSLRYLGKIGKSKVFITPYAQKRFEQRNLLFNEALEALGKRGLSYPVDEDGRQKIRSKIGSGKEVFLTIFEKNEEIIIITGGEK